MDSNILSFFFGKLSVSTYSICCGMHWNRTQITWNNTINFRNQSNSRILRWSNSLPFVLCNVCYIVIQVVDRIGWVWSSWNRYIESIEINTNWEIDFSLLEEWMLGDAMWMECFFGLLLHSIHRQTHRYLYTSSTVVIHHLAHFQDAIWNLISLLHPLTTSAYPFAYCVRQLNSSVNII